MQRQYIQLRHCLTAFKLPQILGHYLIVHPQEL